MSVFILICTVLALQGYKTTGTAVSNNTEYNYIYVHIKTDHTYTQLFVSAGYSPVKNKAPQSGIKMISCKKKISIVYLNKDMNLNPCCRPLRL